MRRTITLGIAGAAIAIGFPIAVLAAAQAGSSSDDVPDQSVIQHQEQIQVQEPATTQNGDLIQIRRRLQAHIETGPPEGMEPIQNQVRTRQQEQIQSDQSETEQTQRAESAQSQARQGAQQQDRDQERTQLQSPESPPAESTGECPHNGDCPASGDCPGGQNNKFGGSNPGKQGK